MRLAGYRRTDVPPREPRSILIPAIYFTPPSPLMSFTTAVHDRLRSQFTTNGRTDVWATSASRPSPSAGPHGTLAFVSYQVFSRKGLPSCSSSGERVRWCPHDDATESPHPKLQFVLIHVLPYVDDTDLDVAFFMIVLYIYMYALVLFSLHSWDSSVTWVFFQTGNDLSNSSAFHDTHSHYNYLKSTRYRRSAFTVRCCRFSCMSLI